VALDPAKAAGWQERLLEMRRLVPEGTRITSKFAARLAPQGSTSTAAVSKNGVASAQGLVDTSTSNDASSSPSTAPPGANSHLSALTVSAAAIGTKGDSRDALCKLVSRV
jgi:hypothetical protein